MSYQFKKVVVAIISLVMVFSMVAMPVGATGNTIITDSPTDAESLVMPRYLVTRTVSANITKSGKSAYSTARIQALNSNASISGTAYIEEYRNGKWTSVSSYSISGTGTASNSKSYTGKSGCQYRTRLSASVSYGGRTELVSKTSATITF